MQPTVPAWVSWYRRVRARDALHGTDARARPRNRIAVYTFGRDDSTTHLIRLNNMLGAKRGMATPPSEPWLRERYPLDTESWRLPVPGIPPDFKPHFQYEPISIVLPAAVAPPATPAPAAPAHAHAHGWANTARGWAAGTALLAVLVLLVRTAEKCLDKKLFQHRNQVTTDLRDPESFPSDFTIDLPPPYSECAAPSAGPNAGANKPHTAEEPPPPYSACYVTYSNPKDGIPSVHFYNRRHLNEPGSSQTDPIGDSGDSEVVFDDGRVVERAERKETSDESDHTENTSRDRVEVV